MVVFYWPKHNLIEYYYGMFDWSQNQSTSTWMVPGTYDDTDTKPWPELTGLVVPRSPVRLKRDVVHWGRVIPAGTVGKLGYRPSAWHRLSFFTKDVAIPYGLSRDDLELLA